MRVLRTAAAFFFVISSAFAGELKIKVVDPESAAVGGAQISLARTGDGTLIAGQSTSAEGLAEVKLPGAEPYHLTILAPGFAVETRDVSSSTDAITIHLRLAPASETVVVTATRSPVAAEATGAEVATLNDEQLETMQPVAASDAIRFLPGAVINTAGQRGGLSSLFVRGGDSTYNKMIVDGVTINEPGGTFDFGTLSLDQADRLEFVRGAQSTLYGSDAMTSAIQVWTRTGSTRVPDLRFGADGGNFSTANGYGSLSGVRGRFDYNAFADQFNTNGSGLNDSYSDSTQGGNLGAALNDEVSLRVRVRHSNTHTGIPGEWNFNGAALQPPDPTEWSQYNNVLGSVELSVNQPSGWQHRFTGFDYLYRYSELNINGDNDRIFDFPSHEVDRINRAGFEYQGDYSERNWAHTTFGFRIENENGYVGDVNFGQTHGQRLESDLYAQQQLTFRRLNVIAGGRLVHNSAYGNTGVPRIALTYQALRGNEVFSGTRLHFSYATGFKDPRLEETFAGLPFSFANTALKPERVRAFEAGIQQNLFNSKYVFNATYFNNLFRNQINYVEIDLTNFIGEYLNVNKAIAHGAELELQAKLHSRLLLNAAYTYTSTQILDNPAPVNNLYDSGQPLLRRPKHSATLLLSYLGTRWGGNLGGSFVGRRPDSDFLLFNIDHASGYVRADLGGWYAINPHVTTYFTVENALDRRYNEVVGYPALPVNFRAGFRFRVGGE
ncbi:MAG TPA: TonB-dependent receptor [Candidatus Sulfotelmatobacter sp.]